MTRNPSGYVEWHRTPTRRPREPADPDWDLSLNAQLTYAGPPAGTLARVTSVLLTGAAGRIATALREPLRDAFDQVILSDVAPIESVAPNEVVRPADLADREAVRAAAEGADAVVHLGAVPQEAPFDELAGPNLHGTYHVLEAARLAGARRVVLASSMHATGFYPTTQRLVGNEPVRPDSLYGVTKVFAEALGRLYADKFAMEVACLRIGTFGERPSDATALSCWLSPADAGRLVIACLTAPDLRYEVVYGVSANRRAWWATAPGRRIGYEPRDDAETFAAEIEGVPAEPQGGDFAARERHASR
jgi:uronate dehydrogenase